MSKIWSNPTWTFFHVFAEKVSEQFYNRNRDICLQIIKSICNLLPCPVCRVHATNYMRRINIRQLNTKNNFKRMLFVFHNHVNRRLRKPLFKEHELIKYKDIDIFTSVDLMSVEIKRFNKNPGSLFSIHLIQSDLKMLNNIRSSIYKHKRFFL